MKLQYITVYEKDGEIFFNDQLKGIYQEKLYKGMDRIIKKIVKDCNYENYLSGGLVVFLSDKEFPGSNVFKLEFRRFQNDGVIYYHDGIEGWNCATFGKYFNMENPPKNLYFMPYSNKWLD